MVRLFLRSFLVFSIRKPLLVVAIALILVAAIFLFRPQTSPAPLGQIYLRSYLEFDASYAQSVVAPEIRSPTFQSQLDSIKVSGFRFDAAIRAGEYGDQFEFYVLHETKTDRLYPFSFRIENNKIVEVE